MPKKKNKLSRSQRKRLARAARNEKKASEQSPATAQQETATPRQKSPVPPPPPRSRKGRWQPSSSSSPKVNKNENTPPKAEHPEPPQEASTPPLFPYQANRDWSILNNHLTFQGTQIEMMYTGQECIPPAEELECPEQEQQQNPMPYVEALPGITHAKVQLPKGVLPTANCLPEMSSYINAIDFFAHPERHQPDDPNAGQRTTVTITPKEQEQQQMAASSMELVPLGTYEGSPLETGFLNMAFQTFSTMDFTLYSSEECSDANCTSYNAEMSPTMMLTAQQQQRLQDAVMQEEMPLVDALLPIVQDIRNECAQMRQPPAVHPLPCATMQIYSEEDPNIPSSSSSSFLTPQDSQAGEFGSEQGSVTNSRTVLLPTPQGVPMVPPNLGNPPMFVQPNFNPNYGQQPPPPRYPGFVMPYHNPPYYVQQLPRYPVFVQPNFIPRYPSRYPVFYSAPPPQPNGNPSVHQM